MLEALTKQPRGKSDIAEQDKSSRASLLFFLIFCLFSTISTITTISTLSAVLAIVRHSTRRCCLVISLIVYSASCLLQARSGSVGSWIQRRLKWPSRLLTKRPDYFDRLESYLLIEKKRRCFD